MSDDVPFDYIPEWKTLYNKAMAAKKEARASKGKIGVSHSTIQPSKNSNDSMDSNLEKNTLTASTSGSKENPVQISTSKDTLNCNEELDSPRSKRSSQELTGKQEEESPKRRQTTVKKPKQEFQVVIDEEGVWEDDGMLTDIELECCDCSQIIGYSEIAFSAVRCIDCYHDYYFQ